jgi:sulfatase maturation enzyme AslB (radical SAM superfamily)
MSWDGARSALDRALASEKRPLDIVFFGGEPLLEIDLVRRAIAYVESSPAGGRGAARFAVVTNGTLLDEAALDFFVTHDVDVQISFDGVREAQRLRGPKTFEILDALLDLIRRRHRRFYSHKLSVAMTLSPSTVPFFGRSIEYFLSTGITEIGITPKLTHDPRWSVPMIDELDAQFRDAWRASVEHFRRTGAVPVTIFRKSGRRRRRPESISMCGVVTGEQLAVDVDGQAHGCVLFADSYQRFPTPMLRERIAPLRLGDVRDDGLGERLRAFPEATRRAEIFHDKQEKYSSYARCGSCRWLASCSVCPTSIAHIPGNDDPRRVPDFSCAYNLVSLKWRARFPRVRPRPRLPRLDVATLLETLRA